MWPIKIKQRPTSFLAQMSAVLGAGMLGMATPTYSLAGEVTDLRIWPHSETTRIVFESDEPLNHRIFKLTAPSRLIIDLRDYHAPLPGQIADTPVNGAPIEDIRLGKHGETARVVFDLDDMPQVSKFELAGNDEQPHRLVIDVVLSNQDSADAVRNRQLVPGDIPKEGPAHVVKVAIDAGHGGKDPGAIGPAGTYEKDVVLAIAKKVATKLSEREGFDAILTRRGDRYIGLRERTEIARRQSVSAFISIHADAAQRISANGGSIYALSPRGASSETARWLAANQNQAVTEDDKLFLRDAEEESTRQTLLDLSLTRSISSSLSLGDAILRAMGEEIALHKDQVARANFAVLRSPDTPSLLVETGFLSNPEEEQRLITPSHQALVAERIVAGIIDYFGQDTGGDD